MSPSSARSERVAFVFRSGSMMRQAEGGNFSVNSERQSPSDLLGLGTSAWQHDGKSMALTRYFPSPETLSKIMRAHSPQSLSHYEVDRQPQHPTGRQSHQMRAVSKTVRVWRAAGPEQSGPALRTALRACMERLLGNHVKQAGRPAPARALRPRSLFSMAVQAAARQPTPPCNKGRRSMEPT